MHITPLSSSYCSFCHTHLENKQKKTMPTNNHCSAACLNHHYFFLIVTVPKQIHPPFYLFIPYCIAIFCCVMTNFKPVWVSFCNGAKSSIEGERTDAYTNVSCTKHTYKHNKLHETLSKLRMCQQSSPHAPHQSQNMGRRRYAHKHKQTEPPTNNDSFKDLSRMR